MSRDQLQLLLACLLTLALVAPLAYLWQQSRVPSSYSVMDMGSWTTEVGRSRPTPPPVTRVMRAPEAVRRSGRWPT